jgi:hypothetical protein
LYSKPYRFLEKDFLKPKSPRNPQDGNGFSSLLGGRMKVKGLILALSLALVMFASAEAAPAGTERILPSQVKSTTQFDLAKTFGGVVFSSSQVKNNSIVSSKNARELLNLDQIELKDGQIVYPEEILVFINKARPPHESPASKPPHE